MSGFITNAVSELSESGAINAPMQITVGIDPEEYRRIVEDLIGNLPTTADSILKRALNATAKKVGRELGELAQDRYEVKKLKFAREIKYRLATDKNLSAELIAQGEMLAASHFKTSPSTPDKPTVNGSRAVRLSILKSETAQTVTHPGTGLTAFLTQFASGHVAVVQRKPPRTYSTGRSERESKYGKNADMTRLRQFFGPSAPKMLEKVGITEKYVDENQTKIKGYLENYILTFLSREEYFASKK